MRSLLLLPTLLFSACSDAVGPAGGCDAEMREIRRENGSPDSVQSNESSGDHFETWAYDPGQGQEGKVYFFRWGVSVEGCLVEGPYSLDVIPEEAGLLRSVIADGASSLHELASRLHQN